MVSGTIGKTTICSSEDHTQQVRKSGNTTVVDLSRDFFCSRFQQTFCWRNICNFRTLPKAPLADWETFFQKMNISRQSLLLEDIEFEKALLFYGSDQIEAWYILSTTLMQRILSFKKKTGRYLDVIHRLKCFYRNPAGKDLFEGLCSKGMVNYSMIAEYYSYLILCMHRHCRKILTSIPHLVEGIIIPSKYIFQNLFRSLCRRLFSLPAKRGTSRFGDSFQHFPVMFVIQRRLINLGRV